MYCRYCGTHNVEEARQCAQCGKSLHPIPESPYSAPQQSGKAVASLICSIAGLFMCLFVGQIIGLVLGYGAKRDIEASQGRLTGEGLAKAGIIIGWVGIGIDGLLVLIWLIALLAFATMPAAGM